MRMFLYIILVCTFFYGSLGSEKHTTVSEKDQTGFVTCEIRSDKYFYGHGSLVDVILTFQNDGVLYQSLDELSIKLVDLNTGEDYATLCRSVDLSIAPNERKNVKLEDIWKTAIPVESTAIAVYLSMKCADTQGEYKTFFRVGNDPKMTSYTIDQRSFKGLPVFTLERGLSAEYAVQKAISNLSVGISHSWGNPYKGAGPLPVESTPDFLQRSLDETVNLYNDHLGKNAVFKTVIISTGIPSAPYLSRAVNAPILPIHFLVGASSIKEVQTILDLSKSNGLSAYATLGHDYSLSETTGVAWIKLLSLPETYKQFLIDHQVEKIIIHGALGEGGESKARKVIDNHADNAEGSIYLMHFAGDLSETYLSQTIRDFKQTPLGSFQSIADWEAGITDDQILNIADDANAINSIFQVNVLTTNDAIHLWSLGTYMMLNFIKKNRIELRGFSFNPYLIGHPVYESYFGLVPFLYWQGIGSQYHIDSRLNKTIRKSVCRFFPDVDMTSLTYSVNSTNNFGGLAQGLEMENALGSSGYHEAQTIGLDTDEVWDTGDNLNASCEQRASDLTAALSRAELLKWNSKLKYLNSNDLNKISILFPEIIFLSSEAFRAKSSVGN